jgi:hypothetical protein
MPLRRFYFARLNTFRHRVKVAPGALLDTRTLQPPKENLGRTGIVDGALTQATFDLSVRRRLTLTARCAPLARWRWSGLPRSPSPAAARKRYGNSCPTRQG